MLSGVFIGFWKYYLFRESEYSNNLLEPDFLLYYNLSMDSIAYNGPIYEICENGTCYVPNSAIVGMSVILIMLFSCFFIMSYFGFKCYTKLQLPSNMSNSTKSLQKQLFVALLIQSINPIIFMYIPLSMLFLSPIFGIGFGSYANILMICLSIYPPLDQFAIIYIIRDFRIAINDFFMGKTQNDMLFRVSKRNSVGSNTNT
ncbi:unnamed protein product [Caenorhabditis angaria]|uniref:Seven TM Receptor n=1 Tax=Caenorhabditis angaria TaxID=860376 RepID=A0A9P1IUB5_9PELO|nr:unnamed protein product [Caenorhabditis angaria]